MLNTIGTRTVYRLQVGWYSYRLQLYTLCGLSADIRHISHDNIHDSTLNVQLYAVHCRKKGIPKLTHT